MLHGRTVAIARDPWPLGPTPGTTDVVTVGQQAPPAGMAPAGAAAPASAPPTSARPVGTPLGTTGPPQSPAAAPWQPAGHPSALPPAEPGIRLVARMVDGVILLIPVLGIAGLVLQAVRGDLPAATTLVLVAVASVLLLVVVGYEPVLVALRGATPGKMTMGLRVVRARDGSVPSGGQSLLRVLVAWGPGLPTAGLGAVVVYASSLLDRSGARRGWHDRASGTRVVVVRAL